MDLEIRRLQQTDPVADFDCGDQKLNDYLQRHAWTNQQKNMIGVTYVCIDGGEPKILGYYTLAASSVVRELLPAELTGGLPRYHSLPVVLLARLAVRIESQGSGLGKKLLGHAFMSVLELSMWMGCRFLIVDAYASAEKWYMKYGFIAIEGAAPSQTRLMFLDVKTLQATV